MPGDFESKLTLKSEINAICRRWWIVAMAIPCIEIRLRC
jgi:hypothetical protein